MATEHDEGMSMGADDNDTADVELTLGPPGASRQRRAASRPGAEWAARPGSEGAAGPDLEGAAPSAGAAALGIGAPGRPAFGDTPPLGDPPSSASPPTVPLGLYPPLLVSPGGEDLPPAGRAFQTWRPQPRGGDGPEAGRDEAMQDVPLVQYLPRVPEPSPERWQLRSHSQEPQRGQQQEAAAAPRQGGGRVSAGEQQRSTVSAWLLGGAARGDARGAVPRVERRGREVGPGVAQVLKGREEVGRSSQIAAGAGQPTERSHLAQERRHLPQATEGGHAAQVTEGGHLAQVGPGARLPPVARPEAGVQQGRQEAPCPSALAEPVKFRGPRSTASAWLLGGSAARGDAGGPVPRVERRGSEGGLDAAQVLGGREEVGESGKIAAGAGVPTERSHLAQERRHLPQATEGAHPAQVTGGGHLAQVSPGEGLPTVARQQGRQEAPYPWALAEPCKFRSLQDILADERLVSERGRALVNGRVQCKRCEASTEMVVDLEDGLGVVQEALQQREWQGRAPSFLLKPQLLDCSACARPQSARPIRFMDPYDNNWLFMVLTQTLGLCTLQELRYYCQHNSLHSSGSKAVVLDKAYENVIYQLAAEETEGGFGMH